MTEGDRIVLRRYPDAGPGELRRRGPNGCWMVVFDDRSWLPRWATEDEMMQAAPEPLESPPTMPRENSAS
jgi:hypothetical protein